MKAQPSMRTRQFSHRLLSAGFVVALSVLSAAHGASLPAADQRAAETEKKMTDEERVRLLHGVTAIKFPGVSAAQVPDNITSVAGYVPGIPRLGIPALLETDGGAGIANIPEIMRPGDSATAFPSMLAVGASFDPKLAYEVGAAMGAEAKGKGFNVLLAGGVNLTRNPRGGRNTEYLGEDPLVSGYLGGFQIKGAQDQGVIATVKHLALYTSASLEDTVLDAHMDKTSLRESDLLAFELAIRVGQPAAVMCSYNQVNAEYACGSKWLLDTVLKRDWHYPGWVMSDWGAIHGDGYLEAGLDQESGEQMDQRVWFGEPLQSRMTSSAATRARVSDAVRRILRGIYSVGLDKPVESKPIDFDRDLRVAEDAEAEGIVLLKNSGALPIRADVKKVLVIGGNAHIGVLAQGGWTTVAPVRDPAFVIPTYDVAEQDQRHEYFTPGPYQALKQALPDASVSFDTGYDPDVAALRAASADVVILFATRWQTQTQDSGNLSLPEGQDLLIDKVSKANPKTVIVLETGNPVLMPWLAKVDAVLEAWYPGQRGADAITKILTGARNPSGHLPITFPASEPADLPPAHEAPKKTFSVVEYTADIGYRHLQGIEHHPPLFPFGFGLSYTQFKQGPLKLEVREGVLQADVEVLNSGNRRGANVVQVYLVSAAGNATLQLVGFERLDLEPGETRVASISIEPRAIASWQKSGWAIPKGSYRFAVCADASRCDMARDITLDSHVVSLRN